MWLKKKPVNPDAEENGKEMVVVKRRLSRVEARLDVLADRVSVLSREDEEQKK